MVFAVHVEGGGCSFGPVLHALTSLRNCVCCVYGGG